MRNLGLINTNAAVSPKGFLTLQEACDLAQPYIYSSAWTIVSVSPLYTNCNEGDTVFWVITTQNVPDGTLFTYSFSGSITDSDFVDGKTSGVITITNNSALLSKTLVLDGTFEGTENFTLMISYLNQSGASGLYLVSGTISQPVVTCTPSLASATEGATINFTVTGTNVSDTTALSAEIVSTGGTVNAADFSDGSLSTTFKLSGGSKVISKTLVQDGVTEGNETFIMYIRSGVYDTVGYSNSVTVPTLANSGTITVADYVPAVTYNVAFNAATLDADPGDAAFTTVLSAGATDEGNLNLYLPISFLFFGTSYNQVGVSSNSYVIFGTNPTTFSFPSFSFGAASPAFPGIGVCAHPGSSTDTNYQYVGSRTFGSSYQMRWKGGYPYSFSTVNRIWDMTFTSGSNTIKLEMRTIASKDASGSGSYVVAKTSSTFIGNSAVPSDGTAYNIVTSVS